MDLLLEVPRLRVGSYFGKSAKKTRGVFSSSRATRAFPAISYFRRNSAEITRSRGNLCNKSYQFAPMATQTKLMSV